MVRPGRILSCALFLGCLCLQAEVYMGIHFMDSLGRVRQLFPAATITCVKPAWASERDAMYSVTGPGIAGTIVVKLYDPRPDYRELADKGEAGPEATEFQRRARQSDDDALSVQWVRWVPDAAIPLKRLTGKYGPWDRREVHGQTYQSQRVWTKRKITALMADDDQAVQMIDFNFTGGEIIQGMRRNGEEVDPALERVYLDMDLAAPGTGGRRPGGLKQAARR